jgi:ecotropic viral integration site 5 protein
MENNHRSAQSILQQTSNNNSVGSGLASMAGNGSNSNSSHNTPTNNNGNGATTHTNSSPTSHSLSRRASLNSSDVTSLNNDELAKMDEISWELWNQIISDWNTWSKKKPAQLKEYIRKGIPIYLRPLAWQYLCGANLTDAKEKFKDYLKKQSACEKIIRRDIDRTYPDQDFFRNSNGQEALFNVMKAYSIHDPEVGYCQGSAFICGLLLIQVKRTKNEKKAFTLLICCFLFLF